MSENHQTCVFFWFVCPLAGDFCWRRGWGWGGDHSGPFQDHFRTVWTKNNKTHALELKKKKLSFFLELDLKYFHIQKITQNLMKVIKITSYKTKHTKHTQIHFQQSIFPKIHKCWVPRASLESTLARKLTCVCKIMRPMRLHLIG